MIGATTINHPLNSTGGIVLQQSSFVFRSPFFNGSYRVSNKGLRNPNSPCIIIIISADKFSKSIPIIPSQKGIRWIVHAGIIRRGNHLFCDGFLSNLLLSLSFSLCPSCTNVICCREGVAWCFFFLFFLFLCLFLFFF